MTEQLLLKRKGNLDLLRSQQAHL